MITENIRNLCKERGISVYKLERDLGLSNGSISKWGQHTPRADRIMLVADYFGVPMDALLRKEETHAAEN